MKDQNRTTCDNNCSHGCSKEKQMARVVNHNQPMLLVLCSKAMSELNAQPYTPVKKVA